jgi:hypothetical protein
MRLDISIDPSGSAYEFDVRWSLPLTQHWRDQLYAALVVIGEEHEKEGWYSGWVRQPRHDAATEYSQQHFPLLMTFRLYSEVLYPFKQWWRQTRPKGSRTTTPSPSSSKDELRQ